MEGDLKPLMANNQPEAAADQQANLPDLGMSRDNYDAVVKEIRGLNQRPQHPDQSLPAMTVDIDTPGLPLPQQAITDAETGTGCSVLASVPVSQLAPIELFNALEGLQNQNKLDRAAGKQAAFEIAPIMINDGEKISLKLLYAKDAASISSPETLMNVEYDARNQNQLIYTSCRTAVPGAAADIATQQTSYYPHESNTNNRSSSGQSYNP